ncbi:MAG TPA: hypothetical protein VEG08_00935 [Terriglobales bacterium]|nr:hypothetical protein [Terriglobales bacterium]
METTRVARALNRVAAALLLAGLAAGNPGRAQAQNKACSLVTPAELQAVLGAPPPPLQPYTLGDASVCSGKNATVTVTLRTARRKNPTGETEMKGIEMLRQRGAQIEVKKFGDLTCSTIVPPASMAQMGYNTTCSVLKNGVVAAVEVTAKTQGGMVAIEKLRPLAEKMASRM